MIASLGMYDRPETSAANDRFWALIRDGLRARGLPAPDTLTRGAKAYWPAWTAADLVLSQTCGLPFRARLHDRVTLVGTPDYGVEGCPPGHYRSVIVAGADDERSVNDLLSGAILAVNEPLSQSGWAAPQAWFDRNDLAPGRVLITGAHSASAAAVADGRAEAAAIDAVTWSLLTEHDGFTDRLKVVGHTEPSPGLPYISAKGADGDSLFDAIDEAINLLEATDRACLRLRGLVRIPATDYLALPVPASPDQIAQSA